MTGVGESPPDGQYSRAFVPVVVTEGGEGGGKLGETPLIFRSKTSYEWSWNGRMCNTRQKTIIIIVTFFSQKHHSYCKRDMLLIVYCHHIPKAFNH